MAKRGMLGPDKMSDAALAVRLEAATQLHEECCAACLKPNLTPRQRRKAVKDAKGAMEGLNRLRLEQMRRERERARIA